MIKAIFSSLIVFLLGFQVVSAQNATATDPFEIQNTVYKTAIKNLDLMAATNALYNMLAIKPERTDLNDSLLRLYFIGERFAQSYSIGEQILNTDPKRMDVLEVVAVSKENLGMIKESLDDYQKLFDAQKSLYYLYQMATLQYQLKRYGECLASLNQIISSPDADKQKVNIRLQTGQQEVPVKAAAYNVRGICAIDMNQPDAAKEAFNKALSIFPDFVLAKSNLEAMNKKSQEKQMGTSSKSATTSKSAAAH